MTAMTVRTNNKPRDILGWHELTAKERAELDYIDTDEKQTWAKLFRYKGNVYDLGDCMRVEQTATFGAKWQGYFGETFFSAVVVRYVSDYEQVVVGHAFC